MQSHCTLDTVLINHVVSVLLPMLMSMQFYITATSATSAIITRGTVVSLPFLILMLMQLPYYKAT